MTPGAPIETFVLQPVSGKAIPMQAGQVLRITQLEGEQCVDFNAFNLEDYKEHLSVGHSRRQGIRLREGHVLLSNRLRPMLRITSMPGSCVTDLLGARCNAPMFERKHGFEIHTNCQDTLAATIGEYDLTWDDVHDSFNMWMNTNWDAHGRWWVEWNTGRRGDHVDLLACFDTLAAPVVCGSGDVSTTSNFNLRPIQVSLHAATEESEQLARETLERMTARSAPRNADGFAVNRIKPDRQLVHNPSYEPAFPRFPLGSTQVEVELDADTAAAMQQLVDRGFAHDLGDAVRKAFMVWYLRNYSRHSPQGGDRFRW